MLNTPRPPAVTLTRDEFNQTIRLLNENYDLGIQSDAELATSPHDSNLVLHEVDRDREAYEIYHLLHAVHSQGRLSSCTGRFTVLAQQLSYQWLQKSQAKQQQQQQRDLSASGASAPLGTRPLEGRAALRQCLRKILLDSDAKAVIMEGQPKKLYSDNLDDLSRKNKNTRYKYHNESFDSVDSIPHRSRQPPSSAASRAHQLPPPGTEAYQTQHRWPISNTTSFTLVNTSVPSLTVSNVFSTLGAESTHSSSQGTLQTQYSQESFSLCARTQDDLNKSFYVCEENKKDCSELLPQDSSRWQSNREQGNFKQNGALNHVKVEHQPITSVTVNIHRRLPVDKKRSIDPIHHAGENRSFEVLEPPIQPETPPFLRAELMQIAGAASKTDIAQSKPILTTNSTNAQCDKLFGKLRAPSIDAMTGSWEERLQTVWPVTPMGLNEAPLPILWEVTRSALYCGVNLCSLGGLKYEPPEGWHDQVLLREKLSAHPSFMGKELPRCMDSNVWQTSMDGFKKGDKVVILSAELTYNTSKDGHFFNLELQDLTLRLGHRLDRRFGSDRFLEVVMPSPTSVDMQPSAMKNDKDGPDKIFRWLSQEQHYFLGRFWIPFYTRSVKRTVKDTRFPNEQDKTRDIFLEQVYFFAIDGNDFRNPAEPHLLPHLEEAQNLQHRTKLSYTGLLEWAIGLSCSGYQPALKLFARMALNLSRTSPTVVLEPHQILHRDQDILSPPNKKGDRNVMNDGIGRMSRSLAKKVAGQLGLLDTPSAFQARLGSAKGMWIVDVDDDGLDDKDWIETYPSQIKWVCPFLDPHHRTFEVRSWSRELRPASLNQQFIPILEARSRDREAMRTVVTKHLQDGLCADLASIKSALNHPMDLRLWMQQSCSTTRDRLFHGGTRFLGGLPDKYEDKIAFLLDSGFDPKRLLFLKDMVWDMRYRKAMLLKAKMNIQIPCSTYAYMVVDFSGVLQPDEVHLSFSTKFQVEGFSDTLLEGMDILVARAPAHFPSDIQKVRVVSRPELRKLKDVIVFPTTGPSALADKLSGGDYDGDQAWICWDQGIVKNFENARTPPEFDFVSEGYLDKQSLKFQDLVQYSERLGHSSRGESKQLAPSVTAAKKTVEVIRSEALKIACASFAYLGLSFSMQQSLLGRCTKYKEKMCYHMDSVDSDEAIAISALLSNLVDQAKAGITFTEASWSRFIKQRLKRPKQFDPPEYTKDRASDMWAREKKEHVLDYLKFIVAENVINEALEEFAKILKESEVQAYDRDLTRLHAEYAELKLSSSTFHGLMTDLEQDIEKLKDRYRVSMRNHSDGDFEGKIKSIHQQWLRISPRKGLRGRSRVSCLKDQWALPEDMKSEDTAAAGDDDEDWTSPFSQWAFLKASTTFKLCYNSAPKFAWYTAGVQLAMIKSRMVCSSSRGGSGGVVMPPVLVTPEMWAALKADKTFIVGMAARRGMLEGGNGSEVALEEVVDFDDDVGTVVDDVG